MDMDILRAELGHSVDPKACMWSSNEQYLLCSYDYEVNKGDGAWIDKDSLALYDIPRNIYIYIYIYITRKRGKEPEASLSTILPRPCTTTTTALFTKWIIC